MKAVQQWVYSPQPAEVQTIARVTFQGSDDQSPRGGSIQQAVLVWRKEPVYPEEAKRAGVSGEDIDRIVRTTAQLASATNGR